MANQSTFPNQIDTFVYHREIQAADVPLVQRFQELKLKANRTTAEETELGTLVTQLRDRFISADDFNKFQDALVNMQVFIKSNVEDYVVSKQAEIDTTVDTALNLIELKKANVIAYMEDTTAGSIRNDIGVMGDLVTDNKTSLVNAINEIANEQVTKAGDNIMSGQLTVNSRILASQPSGRELTAGSWGDMSSNSAGHFLIANNAYTADTNTYKYSNTHASLGARGFMLQDGGGVKVFDTGAVATIQDATFTPTLYDVIHSGGGTITGTLKSAAVIVSNGSLEVGSTSASSTPFLDFHSSGNNIDYDVRIIASGGNTTIGQGALTINAAGGTTFWGNVIVNSASGGGIMLNGTYMAATRLNGTKLEYYNGTEWKPVSERAIFPTRTYNTSSLTITSTPQTLISINGGGKLAYLYIFISGSVGNASAGWRVDIVVDNITSTYDIYNSGASGGVSGGFSKLLVGASDTLVDIPITFNSSLVVNVYSFNGASGSVTTSSQYSVAMFV